MPRGASAIPALRLERLNKLVSKFGTPESFVLSNIFGNGMSAESDTIKWESQVGNRGMAPFKPPGAPSPNTYPEGVTLHEAKAAFWGEKIFYSEEFLNNLRKEGTESTYLTAQARVARDLKMLNVRNGRRLEWMWSQMFTAGTITVNESYGQKWVVTYGVPSDHSVSLGTTYKWEAGANRDIWGDIADAKIKVHDDCGASVTDALCNSTVLKFMVADETMQTLLMKSAYGSGDLFRKGNNIIGANEAAIGNILNLTLHIVDTKYVVKQYITANVAASGTTVYVGDTKDFATGTATLVRVSDGTTEDVTLSAVTTQSQSLTCSATTYAYSAGRDYIKQVIPFIPNDKFVMFARDVDGQKTAEFIPAPFGTDRHWNQKVTQWEDVDPDGVNVRVENKGLPVLYQPDALYILDVN